MSAVGLDAGDRNGISYFDPEMVEMPLLLTSGQLAALETAAHEQGLTTGRLVRHVIRDFLHRYFQTAPGNGGEFTRR